MDTQRVRSVTLLRYVHVHAYYVYIHFDLYVYYWLTISPSLVDNEGRYVLFEQILMMRQIRARQMSI